MFSFPNLSENEFLLISLVALPFFILLHELGHAIPSVLITKKRVDVFIGSHGNQAKSLKISIGLLTFWVMRNPLTWIRGSSRPTERIIKPQRRIVIIICGPLAPIFVAVMCCLLVYFLNVQGLPESFFHIFFNFSVIGFVGNIIPFSWKTNGKVVYSDGHNLIQQFRLNKYYKEYNEAIGFYNNREFLKAAELFDFLLSKKIFSEQIYRHAYVCYINAKKYDRASTILIYFRKAFVLNANDHYNAGILALHKKSYNEAKTNFEKALTNNINNTNILNNIGYSHIFIGEYTKAISYLDKAISIDANFATAYTNRGLTKAKLGKTVDGLNDLEKAIELDQSNACAYRNFGIYYQDIGNYAKALSYYQKAFELDANTHLIDELIKETEGYLNKTKPSIFL